MSIKSFTINSITMQNRYGGSITAGLPYKIKINATMIAEDIWNTGLQVYLQTKIIDKNSNTILIKSGGNITHSNGNKSGYYTSGTNIVYTANVGSLSTNDQITADFTIENFEKSVLEEITKNYDFTKNSDITNYISALNDRVYSTFSFDVRAYNNAGVTRIVEGKTHSIPSTVSIYVPNTSSQFSAPDALRTAVSNSLTLSASNNSSNLIYSPVIRNSSITGYKQRTDCLVGQYIEKTGTRPVYTLIKWKNTSRLIFSKGFYDNLIILRRPGALIGDNYISHSFPITKLQIKLVCYKSISPGSNISYTNTFIIDPLTELKQGADGNYYYEFTNDDIINFSSGNSSDSYNYLTRQGLTLDIGINLDLVDVNGKQDSDSGYWGSGTVKLVILNPDVQNTIQYTAGIKSDLTLTQETSDNNILYCDQKANSYTINIPAASTNENYIIYNHKISFYIEKANRKIEIWKGYGLPDSKNISSLPTNIQNSNTIKNNNVYSITFTKEELNNKILTALGSQSYYNGLRGDELWKGYFIIESVLGSDYSILNSTDVKVNTSKQIGNLLLSNNRTKIDPDTLRLTVTKYKLNANNTKIAAPIEYDFDTTYNKDTIKAVKGSGVGYINSGETADFKEFGFYHYKDVVYTNLKITIQDLSYDDIPIGTRKWELNFDSNSNLIKGLNNNTEQIRGSNGLDYSRYLYNINQSYLSNLTYNNSFYYVIAGSIFTVESTFTYNGKTYTESQPTKRYKKIVFCDVDRDRFTSSVELKQYIVKNDTNNSIEVQFSEDFLDIGGALSLDTTEPYNSQYQNFYFDGNENAKIQKTITAQFLGANGQEDLLISGDEFEEVKTAISSPFKFDEIMTSIPSSPITYTITINKTDFEKIFGEVKILITYSLNDGAYYSDYSAGATIPNSSKIKTREIYFNTASPTVYKRPFSIGINQTPGDEEILRIDIPEINQDKKYISLGDNLLIDLNDGSFYVYTGSSATKPGAGIVYLTATIPEQDYNTDETKIIINNNIPFREKVGIPENHKKIYKKYSKKTSF